MNISPKDKPVRVGSAGALGPAKPKTGVHQTQASEAGNNLSFEHKPLSGSKQVLPLQPSAPATKERQQAAAYEPWGWKAIALPHMGARTQRYVHCSRAGISVSEQQGLGLHDKATYMGFCDSVAAEIMRGYPATGIPPQARRDLQDQAIEYSHWLTQDSVRLFGPHLTASNFMHVFKRVTEVAGQPVELLRRACDKLYDANPVMRKAVSARVTESWELFANRIANKFVTHLTTAIANTAIRQGMAQSPGDVPTPQPFSLDTLNDVMSGLAVGEGDFLICLDMLNAIRTDAVLSEAMLEHTTWLVDSLWEPDEDNALTPIFTHIAEAGVILSLSPQLLDQLILEDEDITWLQRQVCLLLGFISHIPKEADSAVIKTIYGVSSACTQPSVQDVLRSGDRMKLARALVDYGQRYMEETPQGQLIANRLLAPIPMLRHNAQRRTQLARVEERLREAFPDENVSFEGERIEDLLTFFVPRGAAQGALTWQSLQPARSQLAITSPGAPTPSTTSSASVTSLSAASSQAPTDAPREAQGEPEEYSMEFLRAQWHRFKAAKMERARSAQAAPNAQGQPQQDTAATPESKAASPVERGAGRRSHKQPGSKPEHDGYEHKHARNLKALPAAVRKSRIAAMTNRDHKYTEADRVHYRQTKHKPRGDVREVN